MILTPRDVEMVLMTYRYIVVTLSLLRLAFFPQSRSHTPCAERIKLLIAHGYLRIAGYLPITGPSGGAIRCLATGPAARPLLAEHLGIPRSALGRRSEREQPYPLLHAVSINRCRLTYELATRDLSRLRLADWKTDSELHRTPVRVADPLGNGKPLTLIPDAAFRLVTSDTVLPCLLEMDMGTVPLARLAGKLRAYLALPVPDGAPGVIVLFVTANAARVDHVVAAVEAEATRLRADPARIWVTTLDELTPETVLATPIFRVAGRDAPVGFRQVRGFAEVLSERTATSPARRS